MEWADDDDDDNNDGGGGGGSSGGGGGGKAVGSGADGSNRKEPSNDTSKPDVIRMDVGDTSDEEDDEAIEMSMSDADMMEPLAPSSEGARACIVQSVFVCV